MKKKVLVVIRTSQDDRDKMMQAAPDWEFRFLKIPEVTQEQVREAHVIIGNVLPQLLSDVPNLEWMQLQSAGTDPYTSILPSNVVITSAAGAYGLAVSEHMLAMLLCLYKKIDRYRDHQARCEWSDEGDVKTIMGARILVVGLGDIGGQFAKKCKALGGYTVGLRRHVGEKPEWMDELLSMEALDVELEKADVVALFLPASDNTIRLFNQERIARMKPDAVLLNGGRGSVIDTEALCDAMRRKVIGGAALDVTDPEPLPADHPLWKLENVLITPHSAGSNHLAYTVRRIFEISFNNLRNYLSEKELNNLVRRTEN